MPNAKPITMLPADQLQLLASGRGPVPRDTRDVDPGDSACVHEQFARRAQETPDAVAIEWGERRLTYRELNALADTVADTLQSQGVGSETTVGILMPRFGCRNPSSRSSRSGNALPRTSHST